MTKKEYRKLQQECRRIEQEWLNSIGAPVKRVPKKVTEAIFERLFVKMMQAEERTTAVKPPDSLEPDLFEAVEKEGERLQGHLLRKQAQYDREIMRESLEMEMVNASATMLAQEMLEGVSDDYRRGFEDSNHLNEKRLRTIDRIAEETQKRLDIIDGTDTQDSSTSASSDS